MNTNIYEYRTYIEYLLLFINYFLIMQIVGKHRPLFIVSLLLIFHMIEKEQ